MITTEYLKQLEEHFGGYHNNVPRNKISELAPKIKYNPNGMSGGDRMTRHGYAVHYSKHLKDFDCVSTVVECGILKGTGLAIWSKLFPNADIIGLDIDISHTQNNLDFLKGKGAFENKMPELYEYDQFADNTDKLASILNGRKICIAIDDGHHSDGAIQNTYNTFKSHLCDKFVYFVEDNRTVYEQLKKEPVQIFNYKKLVVMQNV